MKDEMKARVDGYLELLQQIQEEVGSEETAARLISEIAKDTRMEKIREERQNSEGLATGKQKAFLDRLGVEYPDDLSKQKASELIDAELANSRQ